MREFNVMRKMIKRTVGVGLLAALAYAVLRAWRARTASSQRTIAWESAPFPFPPVPRPIATAPIEPAPIETAPIATSGATPLAAWVAPNGSSACPATHPVKAKMRSGIYHEPGGANYDRTQPDRCYIDAAAAEADGLRRSKF